MYDSSNGHSGQGEGLGGIRGFSGSFGEDSEHALRYLGVRSEKGGFRLSIVCGCGNECDVADIDWPSVAATLVYIVALSTPKAQLFSVLAAGIGAANGQEDW